MGHRPGERAGGQGQGPAQFRYAQAEGYRKALRLMETAERFKLPVITLIDTPGAYPASIPERGINEAIARNLAVMSRLATPIICVVIGEGSPAAPWGSAWAITWSCCSTPPISSSRPEGCANIIWKSTENAPEAAAAMGVTSSGVAGTGHRRRHHSRALGGAHRDPAPMAERIRTHLVPQLEVSDSCRWRTCWRNVTSA